MSEFFSDNSDDVVELLQVIAANTEGSSAVEQTANITVRTDEPDDDNTATYFSTGSNPITIDGEGWTRVEFGFVARVVNIRTTNPVEFAFTDPNATYGKRIGITSEESPFSIGGSPGIDTAFLWIRQAETVQSSDVQVVAYQ